MQPTFVCKNHSHYHFVHFLQHFRLQLFVELPLYELLVEKILPALLHFSEHSVLESVLILRPLSEHSVPYSAWVVLLFSQFVDSLLAEPIQLFLPFSQQADFKSVALIRPSRFSLAQEVHKKLYQKPHLLICLYPIFSIYYKPLLHKAPMSK